MWSGLGTKEVECGGQLDQIGQSVAAVVSNSAAMVRSNCPERSVGDRFWSTDLLDAACDVCVGSRGWGRKRKRGKRV